MKATQPFPYNHLMMLNFCYCSSSEFLPLMIVLILNIVPDPVYRRFTYWYCKIVILPFRFPSKEFILIDPLRWLTFQQHQDFINILSGAHWNKTVYVLLVSIDCIWIDAFLFCMFNDVTANLPAYFPCNYWFTVFCGPNDVYPYYLTNPVSK